MKAIFFIHNADLNPKFHLKLHANEPHHQFNRKLSPKKLFSQALGTAPPGASKK